MSKQPTRIVFKHVEMANQYVADVLSGKILACKWVKLACQRHVKDIERSEKGWIYHFDPKVASRKCKFIEQLPHTKGEWATRKEKIVLQPWQAFIICSVFGWLDQEGMRRFRIVYAEIPRKNSKSTLSAGVGLAMLADDNEHGAEIYSGATTEKQAWEVFRPARLMAAGTPALLNHYRMQVNAKAISIAHNASRFEAMIGKPGDGASPSLAIIDEYHEHDDPAQRDTMLTGMGARRQPLLWIITTAGQNIAGPCYDERLTMMAVLDGSVEDNIRFGLIYTIDEGDDWTKPEALVKANPNYNVSVRAEFLETQQRDAIRNARMQGVFKTKHLNIWVQSRSQSFNMEKWNSLYVPDLDMEKYRGQRAWIGLDLASEVDIAALEVLAEDGEGGYVEFNRYYLPEDTVNDPKRSHYQGWRDNGDIVVTEGAMIDFQRIEEDILMFSEFFNGVEVAYDPYQATYLVTRLMEVGIAVVKYPQQVGTMSPAMKRLDAWIQSGRIRHGNNERHPMTWMMSNVVSKTDAKDNIYPRKERKENNIDGPVGLMMAIGRCISGEIGSGSIYDDPIAYAEAFGKTEAPGTEIVVEAVNEEQPWDPAIIADRKHPLFDTHKKYFEEWQARQPDSDY